jgi:hypothetical protein
MMLHVLEQRLVLNMRLFLILTTATIQCGAVIPIAVASTSSGASTDTSKAKNTVDKAAGGKKLAKDKAAVVFKNGDIIQENVIIEEMNTIPESVSSKISFADTKTFLLVKAAYEKTMTDVAEKSGVGLKKSVKDAVTQRLSTATGFLLQDAKAEEMMTPEALEKHYDRTWDKTFKGKKQFSLTALVTQNSSLAKKIVKDVTDEESLQKLVKRNQSVLKSMDIGTRQEGTFPKEIAEKIKKSGENSIVGPLEINGSFMLFYVKKVSEAEKQKFTDEVAASYRQAAKADFKNEYMKLLHKKHKVEIFGVDGEKVNAFEIVSRNEDSNDTGKEKKKKSARLVNLSTIKDDTVLAKSNKKIVTVKDLKEFFKVKTLQDDSLLNMAQQFGISLEEVVTYAAKLVIDDWLLSKEVEESKYDEDPDVKEKLKKIKDAEILHAYFKDTVKVKDEDVRRVFNDTIKAIPEDERNGNEVSVKVLLFRTQEDAHAVRRSITAGERKFNDLFKERIADQEKSAVDLGYVGKRDVSPEFWGIIKKKSTGVCCEEVVSVNGDQYGAPGANFAVVYVADKRPVPLPSLSNPGDKARFQDMAERMKRAERVKEEMARAVETVGGKSVGALFADPRAGQMLISLVGSAGL